MPIFGIDKGYIYNIYITLVGVIHYLLNDPIYITLVGVIHYLLNDPTNVMNENWSAYITYKNTIVV